MRGAAHIGVLRELEAMGIRPAALAGTSSGGLVAALYAAGAPWDEVEALAAGLTWRAAVGGVLRFRRSGLPLMGLIEKYLRDRRFETLGIRLAISAFDPVAGETVTFREGPVLPAVRATIALPGVIAPATGCGRRLLVDGGLTSCLPTDAVDGVDAVIAVDVRPDPPAAGRPRRIRRTLWIYQQAYGVLHRVRTELDLMRADVVLRPDVGDVGTLDFSQIPRCIRAGREAVRERQAALAALVAPSQPTPSPASVPNS